MIGFAGELLRPPRNSLGQSLAFRVIQMDGHLRLTGHAGEQMVTLSHLAELHVRLDTVGFKGGQLIGSKGVVEKLGNAVGAGGQPLAVNVGGRQFGSGEHLADALLEFLGGLGGRHLLIEITLIRFGQKPIPPGEQCPQRQSHRFLSKAWPLSGRRPPNLPVQQPPTKCSAHISGIPSQKSYEFPPATELKPHFDRKTAGETPSP